MSDITRNVIILNKLSSPCISEAIIILKDGIVLPEGHVIQEAEKIICAYLERSAKNGRAPKRAARLCQMKTAFILCLITGIAAFIIGCLCVGK